MINRPPPRTTSGRRLAHSLRVEIDCAAGPHEVTIECDWSVTLPFDPVVEEIAAALGGARHSCSRIGPRVRRAAQCFTTIVRDRPYPLEFHAPGVWTVGSVCGGWQAFASALTAGAYHEHVAARIIGHESSDTGRVLRAALDTVAVGPPRRWARVAADLVSEPDGVAMAWSAGLHPRRLVAAWRALGRPRRPRSVYWYLEYVYASPERRPATPRDLETVEAPQLMLDKPGARGTTAPALVGQLWRDPAFRERLAATADAPEPDHRADGAAPGCALFPAGRRFDSPNRISSRIVSAPVDEFRSGRLCATTGTVDGVTTMTVRVVGSAIAGTPAVFPLAHQPGTGFTTPNTFDLLHEAMTRMFAVRHRNAQIEEVAIGDVARDMHRAGENRLALQWLLGLDPEHRLWAGADEGTLAMLFLIIGRQPIDEQDRTDALRQLTRIWMTHFPLRWGVVHGADIRSVRAHERRDLSGVAAAARTWLREICRATLPGGTRHLRWFVGFDATVRRYDVLVHWRGATAQLRPGSSARDWMVQTSPDVHSKLLGVALSCAVGAPSSLPSAHGDSAPAPRPDAAAEMLAQHLDVAALRRLIVLP